MGHISFKIFNLGILLPLISSMLLVFWIHPMIVKTALLKDIVDKPDYRKLQKKTRTCAWWSGSLLGYCDWSGYN